MDKLRHSKNAIVKTILYSDIFDFPLKKDELWKYLICNKKIDKISFETALKEFYLHISQKEGYFCMKGKEESIKKRKDNLLEVKKKIKIAKKAAYYLSFIPTVYFIGISGGVAMEDVEEEDDVDFFIITKKGTLFISRFWILSVLEVLNLRRKRNTKETANKICINLLIDEAAIAWTSQQQDVFTAHEIAHIKPIFERKNTYRRFLKANIWINKFMPNAYDIQNKVTQFNWPRKFYSLNIISLLLTIHVFEWLAKLIQTTYMSKHKSGEIVQKHVLAFYPVNYRLSTLEVLRKKTLQLGLLTRS